MKKLLPILLFVFVTANAQNAAFDTLKVKAIISRTANTHVYFKDTSTVVVPLPQTSIRALADSLAARWLKSDTTSYLLSKTRAAEMYVPLSRTISAGVGIATGLGDLSTNRTVNVDTASVIVSKSFGTNQYAPKQSTLDSLAAHNTRLAGTANKSTTLSAGTAISSTGLGDLSANRTINADTTFVATSTKSGYLLYTDWKTFNGKQAIISANAPIVIGSNVLSLTKTGIDTLGTIAKGVWNGTVIDTAYSNSVSNIINTGGISIATSGKTKFLGLDATYSPTFAGMTLNGAANIAGDITRTNSSSTGVSVIASKNDLSDQTSLFTYGSAVAGTLFGVTKARLSELRFDGAGGLLIDDGGANTPIRFATNGTVRWTIGADGSLSGGSNSLTAGAATLSGDFTMNGSTDHSRIYLVPQGAGAAEYIIQATGSVNGNGPGKLMFYDITHSIADLTFDSTGAATFASTVAINGTGTSSVAGKLTVGGSAADSSLNAPSARLGSLKVDANASIGGTVTGADFAMSNANIPSLNDPVQVFDIQDEFMGKQTTGFMGDLQWTRVGGLTPLAESGGSGYFGTQSFNDNTQDAMGYVVLSTNVTGGQGQFKGNTGNATYIWRARLDSSSNYQDIFIGLRDTMLNSPVSAVVGNAIGFRVKGGGNWFSVTDSVNNETSNDLGVAQNSTYKTFKIVTNASGNSVGFYVDGVLKATHTTRIPVAQLYVGGLIISRSFSQTRSVWFDYFKCRITGLSR